MRYLINYSIPGIKTMLPLYLTLSIDSEPDTQEFLKEIGDKFILDSNRVDSKIRFKFRIKTKNDFTINSYTLI